MKRPRIDLRRPELTQWPKVNASLFICLILTIALGCAKVDPINRVVDEESKNPLFPSGLSGLITLPSTASAKQVAAAALNVNETNLALLENKKVSISYGGNAAPDQRSFTNYIAVLVAVGAQEKVILIQYDGDQSFPGWWTRIYDVK